MRTLTTQHARGIRVAIAYAQQYEMTPADRADIQCAVSAVRIIERECEATVGISEAVVPADAAMVREIADRLPHDIDCSDGACVCDTDTYTARLRALADLLENGRIVTRNVVDRPNLFIDGS